MPAPFTDQELKEIVQENISKEQSALITHILETLKPKTTDYKLIVTCSSIAKSNMSQNKHTMGYLWNEDTDGAYTLKFDKDDTTWLIVNVCYIKL